jgi:ankyrin repeat protein
MSVSLTNTDDHTPLHISAECGHLDAAKALAERGAAINNTNKYGHTPLIMVALNRKLESFRYLKEIGADINILNAKNDTAVQFAAEFVSVNIMNLLLDKGMSVSLTKTGDFTPLHVSAGCGKLEGTNVLSK